MSTPLTRLGLTTAALSFTLMLGCGTKTEDEAVSLESTDARLSYGIGLRMGERMAADAMSVDVAAYAAGLEDAMTGAEPKLTEDEIRLARVGYSEDGRANICASHVCLCVLAASHPCPIRQRTAQRYFMFSHVRATQPFSHRRVSMCAVLASGVARFPWHSPRVPRGGDSSYHMRWHAVA